MNKWENKIICGDNLEILRKMPDEFVDLCYIDPPFFTSKTYEVIWNDGAEIRAFEDRWVKMGETGRYTKDINVYLAFMEPRIKEIYRVLKKTGSFYLHCDWHANAHLRIMLDEIFGKNNFQNEIIWFYKTGGVAKDRFARKHDNIYFYTKSNKYTFNPQKEKSYLSYKYGFQNIEIKQDEMGYYTEVYCRDVWDIPALRGNQPETIGYPTQKPEALLERIIKASSNEGDIVLDAFCGCGTTLAVAKRLNRRFIGIDVSPTACRLMAKRIGYNIHEVIGLPMTADEIANLSGYEFQNAVLQFFSSYNPEAVKFGQIGADGGVDGWYYDAIIQVKKSKITINHIKELEATMYSKNVKYGFLVGLEISSGVVKEAARVKTCNMPLSIYLFTYNDLIEKKHVDAMIEINREHNKVM
jgi:DNA modification methylase